MCCVLTTIVRLWKEDVFSSAQVIMYSLHALIKMDCFNNMACMDTQLQPMHWSCSFYVCHTVNAVGKLVEHRTLISLKYKGMNL